MKPPRFDYETPASVDEALGLMRPDPDETTVLAGGQSLMPLLNMRMASPRLVVDLNRVTGMGEIEETDGGRLRLGAMLRQRTLETDPRIAERLPLLAEAATHIAHVPIRTRGTVGGSLAHADPAAELPAAMTALDARMIVRGPDGERALAPEEFFVGMLTTAVEPGELLVGVDVEPWPVGTGSAFLEIARTHGAFALAGAAALVHLGPDGRIDRAALALCGVGPTPYAASWLGEMTTGQEPGGALYDAVGARVRDEIAPADDGHARAEYRRRIAHVLTGRVLGSAAARASSRGAS